MFGNDLFAVGADEFGEPWTLWRVAPDGTAAEFAASTDSIVGSLAFGPDGALYVSEFSSDNNLITVSRVVPEPCTFMLLTLGGVALLRKRAA